MSQDATSDKYELKTVEALKLVGALITRGDPFKGHRLDELLDLTGLRKEKLLWELMLVVNKGLVTQELLQVGTAGTSDYFYKLARPTRVMLEVQKPI